MAKLHLATIGAHGPTQGKQDTLVHEFEGFFVLDQGTDKVILNPDQAEALFVTLDIWLVSKGR